MNGVSVSYNDLDMQLHKLLLQYLRFKSMAEAASRILTISFEPLDTANVSGVNPSIPCEKTETNQTT